ncbi:MAG: tRNA pseudouridine(38-40) synthase TruA [Methanomassiliicoccaceae archaeon]|nr:tRNA pseudouridine(38-40) synthase TruA [Methanomassiliicoccaceae archaeon]
MKRRAAVKIAYSGEGFAGSQVQPGFRTVGGEVLSDIMRISGATANRIDMKFAGRTDKGVNALGNVVAFSTDISDDVVLLKALNAVSKSIFYRSAATVSDVFNPRHATERIYRYVLPAIGIDLGSATECASMFEGEHDFIRFCKPSDKGTVLNMRSVKIFGNNDILEIEFRSEYFLWNLIRRIVSAISAVGRGHASSDDVERALNGEPLSFGLARPDALTLVDIVYEGIEFISPPDTFGGRIEEERFRLSLKNAFFDSL